MRRRTAALLVFASLLAPVARAGDTLVVTPETDHVDISLNFAGAQMTAFGAVENPGDLIIRISGPLQDVTLSREEKRGPFWLEGGKVEVAGAPNLLYLYATRPIAQILPPAAREELGLELEAVPVRIEASPPVKAADAWRKAFFRLKEKEGRYVEDDHAIRVIDGRLFITHIPLPRELQVGTYDIDALEVRSGRVAARSVAHFEVRQVGVERWVWRTAHDHPWLFGGVFTLAMMTLGLLLNALTFRRN